MTPRGRQTRSDPYPPYSVRGLYLLAVGQTICWTGLYYSFAALFLTWEQQLGWAKTDLTLGLTLAVLIAAVMAPIAGRITDGNGGRWMLTLGALMGAVALLCLATVTTRNGFLFAWAAIGLAQGLCLYEACFAFITRVLGSVAQPAILRLTLIAGFASPLSFIAGANIAESYNWQAAVLSYAAAIAFIGAPLHFVGAMLLERNANRDASPCAEFGANAPRGTKHPTEKRITTTDLQIALHKPAFWVLAFAFPLIALNHGMLINHIIPLLAERNIATSTAIVAASVVGPMQVVGRLLVYQFESKVTMLTITFVSVGGLIVASLILLVAGAGPLPVFAFAITQGAAYGLVSVLRPVVIADALGRNGFGIISGWLAVPYLIAYAAAPYLGATFWSIGGYHLMIQIALACVVAGLAAFFILKTRHMRDEARAPD